MSNKEFFIRLLIPLVAITVIGRLVVAKSGSVAIFTDGHCLYGDCVNGYGYFRWYTGDYYMGYWNNASQNGLGAFYWKDGKKFLGNWDKGTMQGSGQIFMLDGSSKWGVWDKNIMVKDLTLEAINQVLNRPDFAKIQFSAMLKDRPQMLELSKVWQGNPIEDFVVGQLAGNTLGMPIYWQAQADRDFQIIEGFRAVHRWPSQTHSAAIWLSDTLKAEEAWACLIFELFNICNAKDFEAINLDVEKGICRTEEEYISRFSKLEHKAILKTQDFYKSIWLPQMQKQGIKSNEKYWFMEVSPDFETWIKSYTQRDGYPWQPYTVFYKQQLQNILKKY